MQKPTQASRSNYYVRYTRPKPYLKFLEDEVVVVEHNSFDSTLNLLTFNLDEEAETAVVFFIIGELDDDAVIVDLLLCCCLLLDDEGTGIFTLEDDFFVEAAACTFQGGGDTT